MSSTTSFRKHSVVPPVSRGTAGVADEFLGTQGHQSHGIQYQCHRVMIVIIAFVLAALF